MYGNKVTITFANGELAVLRNVTEIHYRYAHEFARFDRVAFESDIHGTGITYELYHGRVPFVTRCVAFGLAVVEFCATLETEIQDEF